MKNKEEDLLKQRMRPQQGTRHDEFPGGGFYYDKLLKMARHCEKELGYPNEAQERKLREVYNLADWALEMSREKPCHPEVIEILQELNQTVERLLEMFELKPSHAAERKD